MAIASVTPKALKAALKELASEVHTILDDGTQVTKAEVLARLIWDKALGYTETKPDKNGYKQETYHAPESWAMQYCFERIEGKAPAAPTESEAPVRAADKVRALAKERLNKITEKIAGPPST